MRLRAFLPLLLLASSPALTAASEPAPLAEVELEWQAPADCPTRDQVLQDARGLVTRDRAASSAERITVHASVDPVGDGRWRLTLKVGTSTRRVEAASCAELSRAAALFLALLVEPLRQEAEKPAEPRPPDPTVRPPPPPPPPKKPPATRPAPSPKKHEPAELRWAARAGTWLDHHTLPEAAVLGELGVELRPGRWAFSARGGLGSSQHHAGAEFAARWGALEGCYLAPVGLGISLGPCLRSEVGLMHARASAGPGGDYAWLSLGASLGAELALSHHLSLASEIGGVVPVVAPKFQGPGLDYKLPRTSLRAGLGVVIPF